MEDRTIAMLNNIEKILLKLYGNQLEMLKKLTDIPAVDMFSKECVQKGHWLSSVYQTIGFNKEAYEKAIEKGLISYIDSEHLECVGLSNYLLCYLLGCIWSGDTSAYDAVDDVDYWQQGIYQFPAKLLETLFGVKGIKQLRHKHLCMPLKEGYKAIDELFT